MLPFFYYRWVTLKVVLDKALQSKAGFRVSRKRHIWNPRVQAEHDAVSRDSSVRVDA